MVLGSPGYNSSPTETDRMHCVAFVINAATLSAMDPSIEEKFKGVLKEARARGKTTFLFSALAEALEVMIDLEHFF